jgi:hypothetical protein
VKPYIGRAYNGWRLLWHDQFLPPGTWQEAVDTLVRLDAGRIPTRVHTTGCYSRKGPGLSCDCWVSE